jgi:acetyl-CoA carboxylase biotin carboxyl carrier protein
MTIKPSDLAALLELFSTSGWEELHVELDGVQLFLSKDPNARLHSGAGGNAAAASSATPPATAAQVTGPASGPAAAAASLAGAGDSDAVPSHWVAVTAPNLGTFYRAPKPGAAPFVVIGDSVMAETEVCLLEVMKLFTAVRAGAAGTVRRICVQDAALVEFGTVLFYIEPAS